MLTVNRKVQISLHTLHTGLAFCTAFRYPHDPCSHGRDGTRGELHTYRTLIACLSLFRVVNWLKSFKTLTLISFINSIFLIKPFQ